VKTLSASARKSNSLSRGMAVCPFNARRRAKLVSLSSGSPAMVVDNTSSAVLVITAKVGSYLVNELVRVYVDECGQENPRRRTFDEAKLNELAESIEHNGLIQPITVRPNSQRGLCNFEESERTPPSFDASKFVLTAPEQSVSLNLHY